MNISEGINQMYFESHELMFFSDTKIKYPLLYQEYKKIKEESFTLIRSGGGKDLFAIIQKLLTLDAYLQIMIDFIGFDDSFYSESEILEHCSRDNVLYYKEAYGYRLNEPSPNTLLFNILESEKLTKARVIS